MADQTKSEAHTSYRDLSQQFAVILGILTFVWCTIIQITLFETIFRAAVVYLAVSIVALGFGSVLESMARRTLIENAIAMREAAKAEKAEKAKSEEESMADTEENSVIEEAPDQ